MKREWCDAIVIGGGPGGSAAATFLARAKRSVLVLEKEVFPRFHIGESLLPYNRQIFDDMGVLPTLEAAGLIRKHGAQFHAGNASKCLKLVFRNGRFSRESTAFQVERSVFDHLLLKHARASGAEVREGWSVTKFSKAGDGVAVEARDPQGQPQQIAASFLIDASGRGNLTGNQEGLREVYKHHRKVAVFGHFSGVMLDDGEMAGDTIIVRLEDKWFWLIPIGPDKVSVGCVMEKDELGRARGSPREVFERLWRSSVVMRPRMERARLLNEIQTTSDFSYCNRRLVGPRLLRVGDAAGFMDPIFSAGVYLAMYSGRLAARAVIAALEAGDDGRREAARYERTLFRAMRAYWKMVEHFYTQPFMELFLQPRDRFDLPSAVTALLAGELEGGWRLRWRMRVFFLIIRLQKILPLVPRISFGESDLPMAAAPIPAPARATTKPA